MNCYRCGSAGIQSEANRKLFWYCRTCKDEIYESPLQDPVVQDEYDEYLDSTTDSLADVQPADYANIDEMVFSDLMKLAKILMK